MPIRKNAKTGGSRAKLRDDILNGHYLPGTYLPSARELAKELKISKSSVHNILKLLQEEGLIQIYPNCGALVLENEARTNILRAVFVRPSDFGTFQYLPVTQSLMEGVAAGAEKKNCEAVFSFSDSGRLTDEIIARHMSGAIQGVIYLQCHDFKNLILPLRKAGIPCVIASDERGCTDTARVYMDYRAAARQAVQYLIRHGHRKIGLISGSARDPLYAEMHAGFRGALAEENIRLEPDWILADLPYGQNDALQIAKITEFLNRSDRPEAIFTIRDYRAQWLYLAAEKLGLHIPGDLSVISFDNHTWHGAEFAGLTTLEEPLRRQGELAVELLQKWVSSGIPAESVEVKPRLIERKSVLKRKTG